VLTNSPPTTTKPISFSDADSMVVHFLHSDALIVTMIISNCRVSKILVDEGGPSTSYMGAPWIGWMTPQRPPKQ